MSYKIKKPNPQSLVITENRFLAILNLLYTIGFFVVWYAIIFSFGEADKESGFFTKVMYFFKLGPAELWERLQLIVSDMPYLLIFLLIPFILVRSVINNILVVWRGDTLFFDGQIHQVLHNKQQIASFAEFDRIEMDSYRSEGRKEYSLRAIGKDEEMTLDIAARHKRDEIYRLGQDLSKITRVKFVELNEKK